MIKYKTLEEFFADQPKDKLDQVNALRSVILNSEPALVEGIKWNAPNYTFNGEDRMTFSLFNKQNKVKLVIHMGSTRKENKSGKPVLVEDEGIVEWNSDIRGTISFDNMTDIKEKLPSLRKVLKRWLEIGAN